MVKERIAANAPARLNRKWGTGNSMVESRHWDETKEVNKFGKWTADQKGGTVDSQTTYKS